MKRKGLNIRVDEDLLRDFHHWCLDNSMTMSARLRLHMEEDLYWGTDEGLALQAETCPDGFSDEDANTATPPAGGEGETEGGTG